MVTTDQLYSYSHTIGIYALLGRGFNNPVDMAFGKDGLLYVLNRAGPEVSQRMPYKRVTICTADEQYLGEFSSGGVEDGQLMWPSSIAIDRDGNVYVSDEALQRITIFDSRGRFLDKWGAMGRADSEFNRPSGIAFDAEDNLLVTDSLNCRVQRYTREGRFLESWGRPGRAAISPHRLTVAVAGPNAGDQVARETDGPVILEVGGRAGFGSGRHAQMQ